MNWLGAFVDAIVLIHRRRMENRLIALRPDNGLELVGARVWPRDDAALACRARPLRHAAGHAVDHKHIE